MIIEKLPDVKTKYAINKLNGYFSGKEFFWWWKCRAYYFRKKGENALNIGNLILLEQRLNEKAGHMNYNDKIQVYQKSSYIWIKNFIEKYPHWDESMIKDRAENLAKIYYLHILKRDI